VAWQPLPAFAEDCDKEFVLHEERWLDAHHDRSMASHSHYFAALNTAWANLPEEWSVRFPNPKALRKWLLIETGWCIEMEPYVLTTIAAAFRLCHELTRQYPDDRIYVNPDDPRQIVWKQAKSQSLRGMGKKDFQRSKDDVLNKASELLEVSREELDSNAGRAA
jgi:hypothetical protein